MHRFDCYDEPSSGGADNFRAQSVFGMVNLPLLVTVRMRAGGIEYCLMTTEDTALSPVATSGNCTTMC